MIIRKTYFTHRFSTCSWLARSALIALTSLKKRNKILDLCWMEKAMWNRSYTMRHFFIQKLWIYPVYSLCAFEVSWILFIIQLLYYMSSKGRKLTCDPASPDSPSAPAGPAIPCWNYKCRAVNSIFISTCTRCRWLIHASWSPHSADLPVIHQLLNHQRSLSFLFVPKTHLTISNACVLCPKITVLYVRAFFKKSLGGGGMNKLFLTKKLLI